MHQFGENLIGTRKASPVFSFIEKFTNPLVLILVFASIISFFVGNKSSALVLLITIIISITLEFVNTYRSEKAIKKLINRITFTATVIRDRKKKEIPLKFIVPGDIVFISAGDVVPADCEVLENKDLYINESVLTGESFPIKKSNNKPKNLVFMGTSVVIGYATVRVEKTGEETEFGKIASRLKSQEPQTEFERQMKSFSGLILRITVLMAGFAFLVNAFLGHGWLSSFLFALAIAIGLTPELLPMIMSVSLARGSLAMAKKNVIVRHLPSIQNFGSINTLCTDKTGTLTKGKIALIKHIDVFGKDSEEVLLYSYLTSIFHAGVVNPFDRAIKEHKEPDISEFSKQDEMPFDFNRKRESVVVEKKEKKILITKGAPEEIFKICAYYKKNNQKTAIEAGLGLKVKKQFEDLSKEGFRVLAIAIKEAEKTKNSYSEKDEKDMVLLGFIAFLDPPKDTVAPAIKDLAYLGIETKILTGDDEILTKKICQDIGFDVKEIITGEELSKLNDRELQEILPKTSIFARVLPEQKERIILNLKRIGRRVAYLGDGINDAPALHAADIGISVENAVDVARTAADIVLTRKSLRVLRDGVIEGRKTYQNTLKYILMGLSSNFGNMFSMMAASAFLPFLPMLPAQVLFTNFLYDSSQLSLSSDNVDKEDIKKPTLWNINFIKKYMIVFGWMSSIFDFLTYGLLFLFLHVSQSQFQTGWFLESIATQVFVIYIIRTKKIPFLQSWPSLLLFGNTFLMVLIAWVVPYTFLREFFQFSPLPVSILLMIFSLVLIYLVLVQIVKTRFYKKILKGLRHEA